MVTVRITGVPCNKLQLVDLIIGISIYIYIYISINSVCIYNYIYILLYVNVQWQSLGELPDYLEGWSSFNADEGFLLCQMTIEQI